MKFEIKDVNQEKTKKDKLKTRGKKKLILVFSDQQSMEFFREIKGKGRKSFQSLSCELGENQKEEIEQKRKKKKKTKQKNVFVKTELREHKKENNRDQS